MSEPTEQELRNEIDRLHSRVRALDWDTSRAGMRLVYTLDGRIDRLTRQLNALLEAKAKDTK